MTRSHRAHLNKDQFAQKMADSIRLAGETGKITYNRDGFILHCEKGSLQLHNAYEQYDKSPPAQRPSVLQQFTRGWFAGRRPVPEVFEEAKPGVLPIVRERAHFDWTPGRQGSGDSVLVYRHLDDYHAVGLVYDFPEVTARINEAILNNWGVTFEEAYDSAIQNLREISCSPKFRRDPAGFYFSDYRDNYDPARLLLPDLFADLNLQGDPVVILPTRGEMLVTGADETDRLAAMAKSAWSLASMPRFWSGIPMRLVDGRWTTYQPKANHPASLWLRKLRACSLSRDYGWQQEVLVPRDGQDTFIASFTVMVDPRSEEPLSYCVWTKGIQSLLPRTDLVGFADVRFQGAQCSVVGILVRWEVVWQEVGHLMVQTDLHPARYKVNQFPNEEQLERLGKHHLGGLLAASREAQKLEERTNG
jgi:hypothetical protein